ncbi:MAG: T9SS type A sorting domain-containing protein [Candidatus Celaenobacter antarcticus]|nr:T9SS type A sorting domain-containing protein [Candidatus Celaenobacter antarcticus]
MKTIFIMFLILLILQLSLSAQEPSWQWATKAGGNSNDGGFGITIDDYANTYVTGFFRETVTFGSYSLTSNGHLDIFVAKMDANGNWQWATKAGGSDFDTGSGITIDADGNTYVTGPFRETATFDSYSLTSNGDVDIFVAKMDANGNWQWATKAGGSDWDGGYGITIDSDGNTYVTGYFRETATFGSYSITSYGGNDIFVAKMDANGNWQWATKAGGNSSDCGLGITIDDAGNTYVTGFFYYYTATFGSYSLTSDGNGDIFVAKMDANGNWQWATKAGGIDCDRAVGITIDDDRNTYVKGYFEGTANFGSNSLTSDGNLNIFVAKMDANGNWQWATKAGGNYSGGIYDDYGLGITIDDAGNTYVTGEFSGTATFGSYSLTGDGDNDIFVAKLGNSNNSGIIIGTIIDLYSSNPIENAVVVTTGNYQSQPTNYHGEYIIYSIPFGYGYHLFAYAPGYGLNEITGIDVTEQNPIVTVDITLSPVVSDYEIIGIDPNPNPTISTIMEGGTVHRYYLIRDQVTYNPGMGIEIEVVSSDNSYSFSSDQNGIVDISISSSHIGSGQPGNTEDFSIISVNGEPISPTIDFTCEVTNPVYSKYWDSKEFGKLGVSFFSIDFERGSSTKLIENNPDVSNAELISITRQGRAGVGVDFSVSVGAGVQCGDIYAGGGASAGVGGNISGITEDYYEFPHQDINNWEALAQYILVADGNFGDLDNTLIRFLSLLEEHFTNQTTLEDAYLGDKKGLDVCVNASASASIGAGVTDVMGIGANANIGTEGHALFNIIHHNDVDMNEYNFGVSGTYTASANAGLVIDIPISEDWSLGLDGMLNIADYDGTRGMQFSVFTDDYTGAFTEFHLKFLHRKEYQGWEEIVTYKISGTDVYNAIESVNNQVEILCNPSSSLGNITVPNNLFSQLLNSIFQILYDIQTNQQGDATISFEKEIKDITDINSFNIEIGISLTSAVSAEIGGGVGFEEGKTKIKEYGKWVWGNHLVLEEYGDYIPNIPEDYQTVLQDIVDSVPLWIRILLGLIDVFIPGKDGATFYVGDTGSYMFFPDGAIPSSIDSIACVSWSWYGNSPSKNISDVAQEKKEIYRKNRARAEKGYGMRYGVGGFYQFEPLNTTLLETCQFTIVYPDSDVVEIDEYTLGMYKEDKENHTWIFMGGVLDTLNNTVTAPVIELALYTLAPRLPLGEFGLNAIPDSILADSASTSIITSDIIYYNNENQVADGELFTVNTESGYIITADQDATIEGVQVSANSGFITFEVMSGYISSIAKVSAFSVNGSAEASTYITFYDTSAPSNPIGLSGETGDRLIDLNWLPNPEMDIAGYKIYFDSDESGPPYDGIATVYGLPSPIIIGPDTSYAVTGLYNDTTYYFVITAFDISGNESGYSDEIEINTLDIDEEYNPLLKEPINYPNPFINNTEISFNIIKGGNVKIEIFNIKGQLVRILLDERKSSGNHSVVFDGSDLSPGIYFYRIHADEKYEIKKMLLIR